MRVSGESKLDGFGPAGGKVPRVYPPLEFSEGIVPADRIRVNVSWTDGEFLYGLSGAAVYKVRIGTGEITHIAGALAEIGYVDGVSNHARYHEPSSLWGDGTYLYVIDDQRIRRVNIATRQVDTPLGGFTPGRVWGDGRYLYLTDKYYRSIERASIANRQILRVAGDPANDPSGPPQFADGIGTAARFRDIGPIWGDGTNLYVGDGCSIRKVVIFTFEVTTF